ncbi:protein adenylyltransferase SelO [Acidisphaera sp. L21]|uniref:protein adenylyltransferase SelO n=1 Tax=Acidisphaera sp. L21 TaxID=1641851 RepID=UPI00131D79C4|nr:YdiU family protein [Acidisphaera sp. L21]
MPISPEFRPSTAHAELGEAFFDVVAPADFPQAILRHRDDRWAARIGLAGLTDAEWVDIMARFEPLPGSHPQPLALRYHGHQFRHYNPDLGDGRGFLFAQMHDLQDGRLLDLGTKGSGQTPWSRTADGRLTLKGGVREVLATEMLEAQGVYTSKSLSLVETGEKLVRHDEPSPTRGAVLVRLNHGHIRIGSFQRQAALGDTDALSRLLEYAVRTYIPEAAEADEAGPAVAFLRAVVARVARMGAQWMAAGFVHGVLNTDNINITGESFDYGPWRWLPTYDPAFTAAYFDESGLYSYGRQPEALQWNLTRLAECLLPLADKDGLIDALSGFVPAFRREYDAATIRRLGVPGAGTEADAILAKAWWVALAESQMPFERAFFRAFGGELDASFGENFAPVRAILADRPRPGRPDHAYFHLPAPCTVLIDEVEELWAPIAAEDDWSALHQKITAIRQMGAALGG